MLEPKKTGDAVHALLKRKRVRVEKWFEFERVQELPRTST